MSDEGPASPLVRAELDRILASDLFTRSERLSAFLRFIVERTLSGDAESLKEQVIAIELYGKDPSFDTAADPIVRVDARRLRDKLREYYGSVGDARLVISVPKGQYTPVFLAPNASTTATSAPSAVGRVWPVVAALVILIAAGTVFLRPGDTRAPGLHQIAVTSYPGSEEDPSLSPDGAFVAFSWGGSDNVNRHIWIKSVVGEGRQKLTDTPYATEESPRWSPNGQWIAFTRKSNDGTAVIRVSPMGGPEYRIASGAAGATWTPDSRAVIMRTTTPEGHAALVYQEIDTAAQRFLTDAPVGFDDVKPRVSSDGKTVAFIRGGQGRFAIFLVPLAVGGTPVRVGDWDNGMPIGGLEWMPDGRELLASKWTGSTRQLLRIPADGRGPGQPVAGVPSDVAGVSLVRLGAGPDSTFRLAVAFGSPDLGLRLADLAPSHSVDAIAPDLPFCDATRIDIPGRFSRDAGQVAFVSNRNGSFQLWVANRDGSKARPVTHLEAAMVNPGSWAPDGGRLIFDATIRNRTDIYVVELDSGAVTRLTDGPGNASDPEWSRDGEWIYFSSNRAGSAAIWKMKVADRSVVQLTTEPGYDPRESPDRRTLYFVDRPRGFGVGPTTTLRSVPVGGGPVEALALQVPRGAWDVTDGGIVFVEAGSGGRSVLQQYDFRDRRIRTIARLGFPIGPFGVPRFLAVSGDSRWALASHIDNWERDIMVLDGLR